MGSIKPIILQISGFINPSMDWEIQCNINILRGCSQFKLTNFSYIWPPTYQHNENNLIFFVTIFSFFLFRTLGIISYDDNESFVICYCNYKHFSICFKCFLYSWARAKAKTGATSHAWYVKRDNFCMIYLKCLERK